ncbi:exonuclease domain-containing protein [Streptomyces sp. WMMC500]|uniref:3'-5' exonuclease n=1 Tax=Streptomyces sp. WMMC500 TaxID=3015154 RepID=UPI00248B6007|nr:3'-5' exonuclease [Streptomyces sp. WMMC500]WBB62250.1 exonuclease domain-containing protein [Streptomyces sp. WMMC500]
MATQLLDRVLVVDVEATCWEGEPPAGMAPEIIEIGLCELDVPTGERVSRRSVLVRPERSEVSAFCTRLTTLTPEQVAAGVPFAEACALLRREYGSRQRVWASWGDYDRRQFERQCTAAGVAYPFGRRHVNAKTLYALAHGLGREPGMAEALAHAGRELEGTHHRGVDDAWNIAALLAGILLAVRPPPG